LSLFASTHLPNFSANDFIFDIMLRIIVYVFFAFFLIVISLDHRCFKPRELAHTIEFAALFDEAADERL
jgi:hypothetical protein